MLFVLSKDGVPSHAHIICIGADVSARREWADQETTARYHVHIYERNRAVKAENTGTRVLVGLTSNCPYGLGACWGPAYEALKTLADVAAVAPIPSAEHSTAEVYLTHRGLPQIERWPEQFARSANRSYDFRGVEVTVTGTIEMLDGTLRLVGRSFEGTITLKPLSEGQKLQWNHRSRQPHVAARHELNAYAAAVQHVRDRRNDEVRVTGPLVKRGAEWVLFVRMFEL
jgi:galactose oxidase